MSPNQSALCKYNGEPEAKRDHSVSPPPPSTHQVDLLDSHDDRKDKNDEDVSDNGDEGDEDGEEDNEDNTSDDDSDDETVIEVLIGDDEHEFIVRRETICEQSAFFQEAVEAEDLKEDEGLIVLLPDFHKSAFETYVHWLENGEVKAKLWCDCSEEDMPEGQELLAWMSVYVMADEQLDDHELRTHAMEFLIAEHAGWITIPGADFSHAIWEATSEDSHLRTFIVEWVFHRLAGFTKSAMFVEQAPTFPKEMQEAFAELVATRGLPLSGAVPDASSDLAFQDAMRAKLL
jgi:hypothetical protein